MTRLTGRTASLDEDLTRMYMEPRPTDELGRRMDEHVSRAMARRGTTGSAWHGSRRLALGFGLSLVVMLAFAGGVVAQRLAADGHFRLIDGVLFSDEVIERPGLTNFGQPFAGTGILDGTPAEAADIAADKGYAVTWQLEDRGGTEATEDNSVTLTEAVPACGSIAGGSVVETGRIQLVVLMDDPLTAGSEC